MSDISTPLMNFLGRVLDVTSQRHQLVVTNMANVDTPGYHTRDLDFRAELLRAGAQAGYEGGNLSYASYTPVSRPVRGLLERPDGNNVSVERESLLLADAQMKYNLGVQLLKDEFHGISQAINSGGGTSS